MFTRRKPLHGLTSPQPPIRELPENDSRLQPNSNNHFRRPDSTEEPTRQAPQHYCMHGCGGAP
jgi:hypothetical protein